VRRSRPPTVAVVDQAPVGPSGVMSIHNEQQQIFKKSAKRKERFVFVFFFFSALLQECAKASKVLQESKQL
jgi:hypothetical protein